MHQRESERWLKQAKWDLKAAGDSAAAGNFEWACFQAQQAAEKALKSFLYGVGAEPTRLRSVRLLLERCGELSPSFRQLPRASDLDLLYFTSRYPNALPDDVPHEHFTPTDSKRALALASSVVRVAGAVDAQGRRTRSRDAAPLH